MALGRWGFSCCRAGFLDEEHEGPEFISTNDNNDYTLGKVRKHNIIIAVLPNGEYGISVIYITG